MKIQIQNVERKDEKQVIKSIGLFTSFSLSDYGAKMFALYQEQEPTGAICFYEPIEILGNNGKQKKELVISNIHIHPDQRNKGYGSLLLTHLEKYCISSGVKCMSVFVMDDERLANFYFAKNKFVKLRKDSNILIKKIKT